MSRRARMWTMLMGGVFLGHALVSLQGLGSPLSAEASPVPTYGPVGMFDNSYVDVTGVDDRRPSHRP